jgi:hypothetical protein
MQHHFPTLFRRIGNNNFTFYLKEILFIFIFPVFHVKTSYPAAEAVPWLRWLVTGFPPRRAGFESGSGHVEFVVDKVAMKQVFSE